MIESGYIFSAVVDKRMWGACLYINNHNITQQYNSKNLTHK